RVGGSGLAMMFAPLERTAIRPRVGDARSIAHADRQALRRPAREALRIEDSRLGEAVAVRADQRLRIDADPFALRPAQQIDRKVRIYEDKVPEIEHRADAVAGVGSDRDALDRARLLAGDEREAHAQPDRARAAEKSAARNPRLDEVLIAGRLAR